jgi:hypothetical protein
MFNVCAGVKCEKAQGSTMEVKKTSLTVMSSQTKFKVNTHR